MRGAMCGSARVFAAGVLIALTGCGTRAVVALASDRGTPAHDSNAATVVPDVKAAPAAPPGAASGSNTAEGRWALERMEHDGVPRVAIGTLTVSGERYVMVWNGKRETGTHTFDPSSGAVDVLPADGDRKGTTLRGFFKVEGDVYTTCYGPGHRDRPADFSSRGSGYLYVWKRVAN
ncbi:hypothetical protein R5W24_006334 [Gemmata sp. JC717]|uniref:hypothetical protein n=1 Tax=Gemmata algarum TaxID=2975278 RepID=UPI0021BAB570|nr:hypothetical protein [Gemmata algarum]MDY3557147.1 hypothetical protein [Gemmata algarum]